MVIVTLVSLCSGLSSAMGDFFFMDNEIIGKPTPDFTLKTVSGQEINLSQYRDGKKTIIFFWATWCPHCREALRGLAQSQEEFEKKEIKLVLVDVGENLEVVQNYIEKNDITFEIFLDEKNQLAESYGIVGIPTFFFINQEGIVKEMGHSLPENYEEILSKT